MTYFLTGDPQYHRRDVVSRSCSGWEGVVPTRYGRQEFGSVWALFRATARNGEEVKLAGFDRIFIQARSLMGVMQGYRVKPLGQLVLVSSRHYCPSTPSLSTWWSTTTLQEAQGLGIPHLQASFPLRCFQRLSLPYIATRQCHWRDNRYTRDTSTPVLSY
jgi:hypothetical protein